MNSSKINRSAFLKTCGMLCLGGLSLGTFIQDCAAATAYNGTIEGSDLIIPLKSFERKKRNKTILKSHIIFKHELLQYPICIFKNEDKYTAVLMQCTHQGTELQVFGDVLECPAHGSEFSNDGTVQNGPADTNLRIFPIKIKSDNLIISLK